MSEEVTTDAKGEGKHALGNQLGRLIWSREYSAKNPDASAEQKREAWKSARAEYIKIGRQMQRNLANHGFSFSGPDKDAVKQKKEAKAKKKAEGAGAEA